jgi:hypothetical protein
VIVLVGLVQFAAEPHAVRLVYSDRMRVIHRLTLGMGLAIFLASTSSRAQQQPYPPPGPAPQPYAPPGYYPPPAAPYYYYPQPTYQPPPARIPYRDGAPVPPGYHIEESPRKGLVIAGWVTLLVPFGLSASIGLASTNDSDRWLIIPVAGPFGDLASRSNRCSSDLSCALEPVVQTYLALDGVTQAAGVALLSLGYALTKKEWVSDQIPYARSGAPKMATWHLAPHVFEGSKPGIVLFGELF